MTAFVGMLIRYLSRAITAVGRMCAPVTHPCRRRWHRSRTGPGQPPVLEPDHHVRQVRERRVVGGDERGEPLGPHHGAQQPDDLLPGLVVQLPGRLVRDQQPRLPGQRPGDRDTLLLAAGELVRPVRRVRIQPDDVEHHPHPLLAGVAGGRGDAQRDADVLRRRQHRDQPERLEHERHLVPPQRGALPVTRRGQVAPGDAQRAARRLVETAHDVQQRGLSGPRPAVEHGELACCDGEGDSAQRLNRGISCSERTRDVCRRHHCVAGRQRRPLP